MLRGPKRGTKKILGPGWIFAKRWWDLVVGNDNGVDTYSLTASWAPTADSSPTDVTFTALRDNLPRSGVAVEFFLEPTTLDAAESSLTTPDTQVPDNGTTVANFVATLVDADGYPVVGLPASAIALASSRGATDSISETSSETDSAGRFYFTVVSSTAGTPVFTCTAIGVAITQTATVEFTGEVVEGEYPDEPDGGTPIAQWRNEATLNVTGVTTEGTPNEWGEKTRGVFTLPDTPALGGPAAIRTHHFADVEGGHDAGRTVVTIPPGVDWVYASAEVQTEPDYPFSTAPGGNKLLIATFEEPTPGAGEERYLINTDDSASSGGYLDVYRQSTRQFGASGGTIVGSRGTSHRIQWLLRRNGAGADEMYVWLDGILRIAETTLTFPVGRFLTVYFDWSNNGNRYPTGAAPETRKIGSHAGEALDAYAYMTDFYVSAG